MQSTRTLDAPALRDMADDQPVDELELHDLEPPFTVTVDRDDGEHAITVR